MPRHIAANLRKMSALSQTNGGTECTPFNIPVRFGDHVEVCSSECEQDPGVTEAEPPSDRCSFEESVHVPRRVNEVVPRGSVLNLARIDQAEGSISPRPFSCELGGVGRRQFEVVVHGCSPS
jgi:hypothetical protein